MDDIIKYILDEDIGFGDITSNTLIPEDKCFDARIVSREEGILAGIEIIKSLFREYGIEVISSMNDGDEIAEGDVILELSGNARTILTLERTALNLLMRMCGVATATNRVVVKVREVAIAIGGGDTHRYSLDDMVMIKDNHIAVVGSVKEALAIAKENISFSKKIEIEVETKEDAIIAAEGGADIVMFDNMGFEESQETLKLLEEKNLRDRVLIEFSGDVNEDNILDYALLDVDIISLGALTHSSRSLNLGLDMD